MLLLRWSFFAQPVPDAEVIALAFEDFLEEELEEEVFLGRQPIEDDLQQQILSFIEDLPDEEFDDLVDQITRLAEDDFVAIFRIDDEVEDEAEEEDVRPIAMPEGDDFIGTFIDYDADTDDDEEYLLFNFDFTPPSAADITEIVGTLLEELLAEEDIEETDYLINFDFGNPPVSIDIIAAFIDQDADSEIDERDEFEDLLFDFDFNAIPLAPLGSVKFRNVDIWPPNSASYYRYIPLGQTNLVVVGTVGLGAVPSDAIMAVILVVSGDIRFTDDGQTPTASFGLRRYSGQQFAYSGNLNAIQFAAVTGASSLRISYYK